MNKTLAFLGAVFLASACSNTGTDGGTTTGGDGGETSGGTSTGGTTGTPMPVARLRVAALSPDTKAFDYCLAPQGTTDYIGPVLAGKSAYGGLTFPAVSDYSSFNPGAYTLAFVPPASLDCTLPLPDAGFPQPQMLPGLDGGLSYTVALMGLTNALTISTFTDDASTADPAILRFISAKVGSPGLDMTANTTPTFSNVVYATVPAATSNIDENGYANLGTAGTYTLSFAVHGSSSPLLVAPGVTFTGGSFSSVFTIPPPVGYSGTLSAFVCFDSQQPAHGLASCIAFPVP